VSSVVVRTSMLAWLILSNLSSVKDEYLDAGQSFMNASQRTCCLEASRLTPFVWDIETDLW
jgi:hypothetical protein